MPRRRPLLLLLLLQRLGLQEATVVYTSFLRLNRGEKQEAGDAKSPENCSHNSARMRPMIDDLLVDNCVAEGDSFSAHACVCTLDIIEREIRGEKSPFFGPNDILARDSLSRAIEVYVCTHGELWVWRIINFPGRLEWSEGDKSGRSARLVYRRSDGG